MSFQFSITIYLPLVGDGQSSVVTIPPTGWTQAPGWPQGVAISNLQHPVGAYLWNNTVPIPGYAQIDETGNLILSFTSDGTPSGTPTPWPVAVRALAQIDLYYAATPDFVAQPSALSIGQDATNALHPIEVTPSGAIVVRPAAETEASWISSFSANTGVSPVAVASSIPILSIRPQPGAEDIAFLFRKLKLVGDGGKVFYQLVLNGTLVGASFNPVNPDSGMDADTAATSIGGGTVVNSGYLSFGPEEQNYCLYLGVSASPPALTTLTLVVAVMGADVVPISASMRWTEESKFL